MDLMGGKVVRARHGERQAYRPITTPLCASNDPLEVAEALLGLYPFRILYIADLDAILQRGHHLGVLRALRRALPTVEFWVDAGVSTVENCQPLLDAGLTCVIGSESQYDADTARRLIEHIGKDQAILSLDYAGDGPQGPEQLFARPEDWPRRVIAMTLARVGSHAGPDWERLHGLLELAPGHAVYAAGGVRDHSDLQALRQLGVAGALLASALHDGTIGKDALTALAAASPSVLKGRINKKTPACRGFS